MDVMGVETLKGCIKFSPNLVHGLEQQAADAVLDLMINFVYQRLRECSMGYHQQY